MRRHVSRSAPAALLAACLGCFALLFAAGAEGGQERRLVPVGHAAGGRRVALVIGNDTYAKAPLANARNDARTMAAALRGLPEPFAVTLVEDATLGQMAAAIGTFVEGLRATDLAVFFYAGHGVQVDQENYLVPVDYAGTSVLEAKFRMVPVSPVATEMRAAGVAVVVLDACRDNPFRGARAASGGLGSMEARGTLIAYATGAGQTASDNPGGGNGLFTQELVAALQEPGLTVSDVFRRVRTRVRTATNERQWPAVYDDLVGDVVLRSAAGPTPAAPVAAPVVPTPAPTSRLALTAGATFRFANVDRLGGEAARSRWEPELRSFAAGHSNALIFNQTESGLVWARPDLEVRSGVADATAGPTTKAAYINIQRIASDTSLGRASSARIEGLRQQKIRELDSLAGQPTATHEQARAAAQSALETLQNQLQVEFQQTLAPIVERLCQRLGLAVLFSQADSGLVWADQSLDLTSECVKGLDEATGGGQPAESLTRIPPLAGVAQLDIQRLASESKVGRDSSARIEALRQRKLQELNALPTQPPSVREKFTADAQAELKKLQDDLQLEFQRAVAPIIERLCRERGLSLLFSRADAGLLASSIPDLTDAVRESFDAGRR